MLIPTPPILLATVMQHYISLLPGNDSQATMSSVLTRAPKLAGVLKRYQWVELEPEKDLYDFRPVEADRAFLAAQGKVLIPMVEDKTFVLVNPNPAYALTLPNGTGGYTAVRWDPATQAGFSSLLFAMAVRFSGEKGFRGIATQETAPGLSSSQLESTAYTATKYTDYYLMLADGFASASVPMYWHANYMPQRQAAVGDVLANAPASMLLGGPDNWPDNASLNKMMYPYYTDNFIRTKFIGNSPPSYDYPIDALYAHGAKLGVSEFHWSLTGRFKPEYVK